MELKGAGIERELREKQSFPALRIFLFNVGRGKPNGRSSLQREKHQNVIEALASKPGSLSKWQDLSSQVQSHRE